jgi:hypothetical protein
MANLFRSIFTLLLLGGWGLAALSLHVLRTADGVELIPKNKLSVDDTYVDVRHWTDDDEKTHAVLYDRLKQLDQTDLLKPSSETTVVSAKQFTWFGRGRNP